MTDPLVRPRLVNVGAAGPQAEFDDATLPLAAGDVAAGSSAAAARNDHVHPPTTYMPPQVVGSNLMMQASCWSDAADQDPVKYPGYLPDRTGHGLHAWHGSTKPSGVIGRSATGVPCLQPSNTVRAEAAVPVQALTELDFRVAVRLSDWTPGDYKCLAQMAESGSSGFAWLLYVDAVGKPYVVTSVNGTSWASGGTLSTAFTATDDVTTLCIRLTWRGSDGRVQVASKATTESAAVVDIDDDTGYAQVGSDLTASTGSLYPSAGPLWIGAEAGSAYPLPGNVYAASYRTAIGGPVVAKFDPTNHAGQGRWVDAYGIEWTVTPDGTDTNDPIATNRLGSMLCSGVNSNQASTPSAGLAPTTAFDIRAVIAPRRWKDPNFGFIWSVNGDASGKAIQFYQHPDGGLVLIVGSGGVSSAIPVVANDGEPLAVRVTWDGANGGATKFYTKPTGWDPTVAAADAQSNSGWSLSGGSASVLNYSLPAFTSPITVGLSSDGVSYPFDGHILYVDHRNAIDGSIAASFDPSRASSPYATFTDAQGNTWTLARSTTGPQLSIVERPKLILGGGRYLRIDDYGLLNPGAGSLTVCVAARLWGPNASYGRLICKEVGSSGWRLLRHSPTAQRVYLEQSDGSASAHTASCTGADYTSGVAALFSFVRDKAASTIRHAINGTLSTAQADATASLSVNGPTLIGTDPGLTQSSPFEYLGHAIFPWALSAAELSTVASRMGVS